MPKNYENMVKDVEEKAAVQREREKQDGTGGPRADPVASAGATNKLKAPRADPPVETDPVKLAAIVTQIQQLLNKKDYKKVLELLKNPNAVKAMKTKFNNPSRYDSWLKRVKTDAAGKAAGAGTDSGNAAGASSTGGAVANKTDVVKKSLPAADKTGSGGRNNARVGPSTAQKFIDKNTESLANNIINMMNEATFDTSTSLWRASGGGKRKLPAVKQMQQWLNNNGFDAGKADGWYGKGTARAVKAMQQAYGLSADGDAGPNTLSAMNKASPEPVDQDAEIAAMAAQTKGDLDQDDSVGAVGAAGAAAGSIKGGKAPAGVAAGVASGAAAGDPEPDQTVTTTAPVDSTDDEVDAATDNVNKSMAAGNVTGVQSDAEKAAADLKAKQDASSAAAQAQFQKTKGDVSDKLGGAPDQTITTTGGAAANAGTAGNRGGVDTAIAAKTAELNRAAKQRKAEQLRRQQERAALQRRKSASSSVQGRDDNVDTGAGVGTNSGNWKPKAGTVVRQSMYKESGIKFSGSIANAIAKLGKKR